jgi:hypothetical protein
VEEPVFRICLLSLLACTACTACTDGPVRSGTVAEPADFLPTISDTTSEALSTEQPRLVLRCEEGRVGAYIIVGTVAEVESGRVDDRAVPVRLDSAPSC